MIQQTSGGASPETEPAAAGPAALPRNTILVGDVRSRLRDLPTASVDTVITSPPYFGVRDYGHEQQLGAESTVDQWVADLRSVCCEVARVLRPTGSFWLNLGDTFSRRPVEGAPSKSLLLGPSRLAMALVADGWILRNHVVWAKSNAMPSSVTDRLATTHEVLYFFTRSRRYFFDLDAIRVPLASTRRQTTSDPARTYPPPEAGVGRRQGPTHNRNGGLSRLKANGLAGHPLGKNPGDVWWLATAGYRGAHFATFPLSLIERPILATCPEKVCNACGSPWNREAVRRAEAMTRIGRLSPGCRCPAETAAGVVLDPFMGSGTTAIAAEKHSRDWVGIELNRDYVAMAEERLAAARTRSQAPTSKAREQRGPAAA